MRRPVVSVILVLLFGALVAGVALGAHPSWTSMVDAEEIAGDDVEVDESDPADSSKDSEESPEPEGEVRADPEAPPEPLLERPLRVASAHWEWLAPATFADGEASLSHEAFGGAPLGVEIASARNLEALEAALAKGGGEDDGADVVLLPLAEFSVAFERLRALEPRVFLLAGWSAGEHALLGKSSEGLLERPSRGHSVDVGAQAASAELFMAAWLFERAGWDDDDWTVQSPGGTGQMFRAVAAEGRGAAGYRTLTSTSEATALVPYVAVVPGGFADAHPRALVAFAAGYLGGAARLKEDVPSSARALAALPGTPQTVEFVQALGRVRFADLGENARRFSLTGRDLVTLDLLFDETWRIWRELGVVNSPTPASLVDPAAVTALVLRDPSRVDAAQTREHRFDTDVILRESFAEMEPDELVRAVGVLAGVFERSALRLGVARGRNHPTPDAIVRRAAERYGFDAERVQTTSRVPRRQVAAIEVLAAP